MELIEKSELQRYKAEQIVSSYTQKHPLAYVDPETSYRKYLLRVYYFTSYIFFSLYI